MLVDTHTHVVADDLHRYPHDPRPGASAWYVDVPHTVESLVALMGEAGVDRAILVQAVSAYQHDNRYVVDAALALAERCTSVVCLDVTGPETPTTLRRLIVEQRVRGLRWWALDGAPLDVRPVWDVLAETGSPAVVTCFADRLGELTALIPSLPPVPIAVDHCAFADLSDGVPDVMLALAAHPTVHWKISTIVLDGLAEHGDVRDGVAELSSRLGADRVMWGSDFSQTNDRPYRELAELARHAASKLDDDARGAFLGGNALRLWPELAP
jgi:predicted TIM-barrel fold metal-dependent hydrolase